MSEESGTASRTSHVDLRDFLRVVRQRKWTIALGAFAALTASVVLSQLQTPMYEASAQLLLQPRGAETIVNQQSGSRLDPARTVQTEILVIESNPVRDRVLARMQNAPAVSASPVGQTDVVRMRVESPDPAVARDAANAYAQAYIDHRREEDVRDLTQAIVAIQEQIAQIQSGSTDANARAIEQVLTSLEETRQDLALSTRLKEGGARVVNEAQLPAEPFKPTPVRNGLLALVVGAIGGLGIAFFREYLDDAVRDKDDLERVAGLPVLGMIPSVGSWRAQDDPFVISISEPSSPAAEAYRILRTAIQFMSLDKPTRVVQVTSPSAGDGKTTTIANLGVALARAGYHVVIVCCDLRRPRVHEFFGLSNAVGFTSLLLRSATHAEALQPVPGVDRLSVLASGPLPPNPSELLASGRVAEVLSSLKGERWVLIDSPPVLPVTDAHVLAHWADATLVVCSAQGTDRKDVGRTVELMQHVGAPLVGMVLNGVRAKGDYGAAYYYRQSEVAGNGAASAASGSRPGGTSGNSDRRGRKRSAKSAARDA